jgi:hypothetical protein
MVSMPDNHRGMIADAYVFILGEGGPAIVG